MGLLLRLGMAAAVDFDGELVGGAVEVEDVRADGVLASELVASQAPVAERSPEEMLGVGGSLAKLSGSLGGGFFVHFRRCCWLIASMIAPLTL